MLPTDRFVLPSDLLLLPVNQLPEPTRRQIQAEEGAYALTRPWSRSPSLIVDACGATLLREFRKPITIVDAVIRFSLERKTDPEQTLEEAFPMFERLLGARLLVPPDSEEAHAIQWSLQVGARFAGAEICRCVQVLDDTEVYKVLTDRGESAALKILRPNAGPEVLRMLYREAAILKQLDGTVSPAVLQNGSDGARRFLMVTWCSGRECSGIAAELRGSASLDATQRLLRVCSLILEAYTWLHAQGVIHSDVHPRNVLVADDGTVKIIDFGLAHLAGLKDEPGGLYRGGVGFFFEPEYANAVRANAKPPESTAVGEQYSLAALIYFLLTGRHYLNFSFVKEEMLRQIVEEPPVEFERLGVQPWPEMEQTLARALSKRPSERFSSVEEFAKKLTSIGVPKRIISNGSPVSTVQPAFPRADQMLGKILALYDRGGLLFASGLKSAPKVSVTYGSAGVAYALYRIACVREDARLIALGDLWATRATREVTLNDAFYNADIGITPELVGRVSPYHTASGVYVVKGLLSCARGDFLSTQIAIEEFLATVSPRPCQKLDLVLGRSGVLLAAAMLLDAVGDLPLINTGSLTEFGNQTLEWLIEQIEPFSPIGECFEIPDLGVAHGWAGILYAAITWCQSHGRALPGEIVGRLEQLVELADHSESNLPLTLRGRHSGKDSAYVSSWCSGSAGFVHLWTLANRILGDEKYLTLAERAASSASGAEGQIGNLCCGFAGRAYALLNVYKHTNDKRWLHEAISLTERAVRSTSSTEDLSTEDAYQQTALRAESLYKGELGIAVLMEELQKPEFAAMPFFEFGW